MGIIQPHTNERQCNAQNSIFPTGVQDAQQHMLKSTKVYAEARVTHALVYPDANAPQLLPLYKSLSSIPKPLQTSYMEGSCDSGGVE
jgi:hypothetical protein